MVIRVPNIIATYNLCENQIFEYSDEFKWNECVHICMEKTFFRLNLD